jgi:hypothetical protein
MEYAIAIFVILLIIYYYYIQTPDYKGKSLEYGIDKKFRGYSKNLQGYAFKDVMIKDDVSSSQIDNILITPKAIYVIEAKNYNGHIFGSYRNENWTVTVKHLDKKRSKSGKVYTKTHISKHKFYNPIKQNITHIRKLKSLLSLNDSQKILNVVVFGSNSYLSDVEKNEDYVVLNYRYLMRFIKETESKLSEVITPNDMTRFSEIIQHANILDKTERKMHIQKINQMYK